MAKPKRDDSVDNIFNAPMKLRHWAVTLIGYLGDSRTNTLPNTTKVDELIGQFVKDYSYYYNEMREEEE